MGAFGVAPGDVTFSTFIPVASSSSCLLGDSSITIGVFWGFVASPA